MSITLRPQEVLLFDGSAIVHKSMLRIQHVQVVVTDQRLIAGEIAVEKPELVSATVARGGFGKKLAITLRDGKTLLITSYNAPAFKAAVFILTGQGDATALQKAPPLSAVKNGAAWLGAVSPIIASNLSVIVGGMLWGNPNNWGWWQFLQLLVMRFILLVTMMRMDYFYLQQQGYSVHQLGLASPNTLPFYLFSRAKVFGHSKKFGIIWCVLFFLEPVLMIILY